MIIFAAFVAISQPHTSGSLVIVGGGKVSMPIREEFIRLAGGKEKAKIVVAPTASVEGDDTKKHESYLVEWRKLSPASLQILHTRDRKKADDPKFAKTIREATAVWFGGGD